jgi:hypothetical protein
VYDYWAWKFGTNGIHLASLMPQHRDDYPRRALVGQATLVDVIHESVSPWFVGRYGFVLADASAFATPVIYPGNRFLFEVPALTSLYR